MSTRFPAAVCALCTFSVVTSVAGAAEAYTENPGKEGNGDHTIGPDYKIDPDLTERGNPKGKSFEFQIRIADSRIFRGKDSTLEPLKKRKIWVYVPAAYKNGTKAPILVTHDGPSRLKLVRNALDNLTISKDPERRLPAFIVIAVQNGGNDGKNSERGLEYDTVSDRFARFIDDEVLSAVLKNTAIRATYPDIAFSDNPWARAAMGCSSGRSGGPHDGLVSSRPVSPTDHLFRYIRRPARRRRAGRSTVPAGCLGIPLQHEADRKDREETAAYLHSRFRE